MARPSLDEDVCRQTIERLGPVADTVQQDPRTTIQPALAKHDTAVRRAMGALTRLGGENPSLDFERTLGEGGMGIVHLATQRALGRKVAVKTLKPEARSDEATLRLLREAWVTGALEHPNVVPVYDVALDESGSPVILLKRIEGVEWAALMTDEKRVRERFGVKSLLDWNLGILMQVCNAISFAHSRGIVHRDLKPENVMIGAFGEVYVVDWGIAVALVDDGEGRMPLAKDATEMAGTLAYMAPEMLGTMTGGNGVGTRSDVYLLGAVLYEIVTGKAPHEGATLMEMVRRIVQSRPSFPELAPEELVTIALRAMDPDPDARFESAEQLRLALLGFVQHRGARVLAEEAEAQLEELHALLERTERDRDALYNVFGAVRFGFRQSLRAWKENDAARAGLRDATLAMIDYELAEKDARGAAVLLAELDDPPPDLAKRVAAVKEEHARAEKIALDFDPNTGRRTRTFLTGVMGTFWTLSPLTMAFFPHHTSIAMIAVSAIAFFVVAAGMGVWARDTMRKTAYNRRIAVTTQFLPVGVIVLAGLAALIALPVGTLLVWILFFWFTVCVLGAIHIERMMIMPAIGYLVATFVAAWRPTWAPYAMSIANLDLTVSLLRAWRTEDMTMRAQVKRARARLSRPPHGV